jgi:hypothetical protein
MSSAPPVSLRVTVRADDLDAFVDRYSRFIDGDRIFIFTKSAKSVGERVRFALCLANGEAVLNGEGTVTRVQKDGDPTRPPGMELRFQALDDSSQTLVDFLLATRADLTPVSEDVLPPRPEPLAKTLPAVADTPPRPRRPTPVFAEKHFVPPAPGTIPANPFSEVSDNAIEFFVEWSLESNVGPHKGSTASFSNVEMALPSDDETGEVVHRRAVPRWAWAVAGGGFAAGLAVGILVGLSHKRPEPPPKVVVAAAPAPPPAAAPAALAAAVPVAAKPPAPAKDERVILAIRSHPTGAAVLLDGNPVGHTPLEVPATRGRHQLTLSHERYTETASDADAPGSIDVPLQRPPATLVVSANVPDATVTVAGANRGSAPVRVNLRGYEKYQVVVSARGLPSWRKSIYLKAPSTEVHAVLR